MLRRQARAATARFPREAWADALTVRSYEAGLDGAVRPGVILRYLESLATRASAGLGYDNRWYRDNRGAWVVREMSLTLGARAGIDDDLRLFTWVSAFRRVQATREYLITHAGTGRIVARAQARWAYIDRVTGQLTRIPNDLSARMGPWGHGMRSRRATSPGDNPTSAASLPLVARAYEADTQGHINNCVYLDWFDEAASQMTPTRPGAPAFLLAGVHAPGAPWRRADHLQRARARSLARHGPLAVDHAHGRSYRLTHRARLVRVAGRARSSQFQPARVGARRGDGGCSGAIWRTGASWRYIY